MSVIRNLKLDDNGWFSQGTFESDSLFKGEMRITLFTDDGVTEEDANRCIEHYNKLADNKAICDKIQEELSLFFLYMYDEWGAMGDIYGDIANSLKDVMEGYKVGTPLISYLSRPTFYVYPQMENEIGYGIECECPWEPEHQCMILIRNDKVVYVGPSEGEDPWGDEDDYYCIWKDNED